MKRFKLMLILQVVVLAAFSQEAQKAEEHFKTSSIISFNTNVKPEQLIGTLIYYKPGKKDEFEYFTILTDEQLKKFEPTYNNKIVYQTMADKSFVSSVKYLSIFSASVQTNYLLEVVLEDVLDYKVPSFATDPTISKQVFLYTRPLVEQGFIVEYVDNVNMCTLTTRLFQQQDAKASGSYFVDAKAKQYASKTDFASKRLISLHSVNVSRFINIKENGNEKKFDLKGLIENTKKMGSETAKASYLIKNDLKKAEDNLIFNN